MCVTYISCVYVCMCRCVCNAHVHMLACVLCLWECHSIYVGLYIEGGHHSVSTQDTEPPGGPPLMGCSVRCGPRIRHCSGALTATDPWPAPEVVMQGVLSGQDRPGVSTVGLPTTVYRDPGSPDRPLTGPGAPGGG